MSSNITHPIYPYSACLVNNFVCSLKDNILHIFERHFINCYVTVSAKKYLIDFRKDHLDETESQTDGLWGNCVSGWVLCGLLLSKSEKSYQYLIMIFLSLL